MHNKKLLKASVVYYQDTLTWCVQTAQASELWKNCFNTLTIDLWIMIIIMIYVCGVVLYFVMRFDKQQLSCHYASGVAMLTLVNVTAPYFPRHVVPRIFYAFMLFYSLLMLLICTHSLFSVLTTKHMKPQISTVNSLIDLNIDIFADNGTSLFLEKTNEQVPSYTFYFIAKKNLILLLPLCCRFLVH